MSINYHCINQFHTFITINDQVFIIIYLQPLPDYLSIDIILTASFISSKCSIIFNN